MPNIIIDSHIVNAIKRYVEETKISQKTLAELCGVTPPAVINWRNEGSSIRENVWARLFPLIRSRLSDNLIGVDEDGHEYYMNQKDAKIPKCECMFVPMFTEDEIESFVPSLDTPVKYAEAIGAQNVPFVPKTTNRLFSDMFCLCVGKSLSSRMMPEGTRVFASSRMNDFQKSSCSLARIDGKTEIVTHSKDGDETTFRRMSDDSVVVSGTLKQLSEHINWIFPVLYYEVVTYSAP